MAKRKTGKVTRKTGRKTRRNKTPRMRGGGKESKPTSSSQVKKIKAKYPTEKERTDNKIAAISYLFKDDTKDELVIYLKQSDYPHILNSQLAKRTLEFLKKLDYSENENGSILHSVIETILAQIRLIDNKLDARNLERAFFREIELEDISNE